MASLEKFKLQSATWDSDKEPNRFVQFMYLISAVVRSIAHGNHLEDWLDRKLGRSRHQGMTTPSFLSEDPEFQQPEGATGEESGDNDTASISTGVSRPTMSVSSGVSSGSSHATLNSVLHVMNRTEDTPDDMSTIHSSSVETLPLRCSQYHCRQSLLLYT